jgi:hypothetical protein
MSGSFVQIPPNSTGSKIATNNLKEIHFDNKITDFEVGEIVVGSTSTATGIISSIVDTTLTSGKLYLKKSSGVWINDENIQVDSANRASIDYSAGKVEQVTETQKMIIVDPAHPEHQQTIDRFGATVNTFTDGAPTFSPFGAMTVGERQPIKDYRHAYDALDDEFQTTTVAGGSYDYEPLAGTVVLTTANTVDAAVTRTTNYYHPYSPGVGQIIQMTVTIGDNGKPNVIRRWGYFDDRNGCFWQLEGTQLSIVMRTDVSGSVVDVVVPQEEFNRDKLDGSDAINFDLDVTLGNIYWIDIQWLGSGRVRFGVYEPEGQPIVAHIMRHANTVGPTFPYIRTATLPLRVSQINGDSLPGSTSEMRINCASVKHSSKVLITGTKHSTIAPFKDITGTDGWVPLIALRPKKLFGTPTPITNRGIIKLVASVMTSLSKSGDQKVVTFRVGVTISSAITGTWSSQSPKSMVEVSTDVSAIASSHTTLYLPVMPNSSEYIQSQTSRQLHEWEFHLLADGDTQQALTLEVMMDDGLVTDVHRVGASINWEELLA